MKRTERIANETEFQEWLLLVLEAKRSRLQEQTVVHDSRVSRTDKAGDRQSEERDD